MTALDVLLVAVGGALGAPARFVLDSAVTARSRPVAPAVPPGTLVVNTLGALLLGVLAGLAPTGTAPAWLLLGGTGFCGAFTTFSAASLEAVRLAGRGRWGAAAATATAHLALSLAAAALGLAAGVLLATR